MEHHVLVTYASKRGGTAAIAAKIAQTLRADGIDADWSPVSQVDDLASYDTVILGGALYTGGWIRPASKFVRAHTDELRERDVWMFSSGPLDDSASRNELPPPPRVRALMERAQARGHQMFGGRLAPDAKGFPASAMAKTHAGDWRDWDRVQGWAHSIADTIRNRPVRTSSELVESRTSRVHRWLLAALCAFVGSTAFLGGVVLMAAPDGSLVHFPPDTLQHSPFTSFLVPGLLLASLVGLLNLFGAGLVVQRTPHSAHVAFAGGSALMIWLVTEAVMIRAFSPFQLVYLAFALAILAEALARYWATRLAGVRPSDNPAT